MHTYLDYFKLRIYLHMRIIYILLIIVKKDIFLLRIGCTYNNHTAYKYINKIKV